MASPSLLGWPLHVPSRYLSGGVRTSYEDDVRGLRMWSAGCPPPCRSLVARATRGLGTTSHGRIETCPTGVGLARRALGTAATERLCQSAAHVRAGAQQRARWLAVVCARRPQLERQRTHRLRCRASAGVLRAADCAASSRAKAAATACRRSLRLARFRPRVENRACMSGPTKRLIGRGWPKL